MQFTINGIQWHVAFVPPYDKSLMRSDGSMTVGMTDRVTQTVYLSDSLYGDFLDDVLCHELCHVVCMSWDLYMPLDAEEKLCNFMADHGREIIYLLDELMKYIQWRVA